MHWLIIGISISKCDQQSELVVGAIKTYYVVLRSYIAVD